MRNIGGAIRGAQNGYNQEKSFSNGQAMDNPILWYATNAVKNMNDGVAALQQGNQEKGIYNLKMAYRNLSDALSNGNQQQQ